MTLVIVFGSTPQLAWQELIHVVPQAERISEHVSLIHDARMSAPTLMDRLGGVVKVGRLSGVIQEMTAATLVPLLSLEKFRTFGVTALDGAQIYRSLLGQIKEGLGKPSRFVTGALSSVIIHKQDVCELVVFPYRGKYGVAKTIEVQDYESWIKRDRGRPHADPKSGMLPPKVARMMVNLAGVNGRLLDPFCGMGTVVAEATLLGWEAIGSDQRELVIQKAQENLKWLDPQNKNWKFLVCDATHISEKVSRIDAIVTEPFMGKPQVTEKNIKNIVTGLEKLYIGCFKDWAKILKPGSRVVITLPEFSISGKTYVVKKVIDSCETLGYTVVAGPIEYARATARVRRQVYIFLRK